MNKLDQQLDSFFLAFDRQFKRRDLFKGATAAALGLGALTLPAKVLAGNPALCNNNWGRCNGVLCCGSYGGCSGYSKCASTAPGANCYYRTGKWSRCCNSYWRYDWVDCCPWNVYGYCCQTAICYGQSDGYGCPGAYCTDPSCPSAAYCPCYCCTYRVIVANGC